MSEETRVTPFSNGSQYAGWTARNCDRCFKFNPDTTGFACDLDEALLTACYGDGTVSDAIARRMGYVDESTAYTWDCPEREEARP